MPLDSVVDVPGLCPPPEPCPCAVRAGDALCPAGRAAPDGAGEAAFTLGRLDRQSRTTG